MKLLAFYVPGLVIGALSSCFVAFIDPKLPKMMQVFGNELGMNGRMFVYGSATFAMGLGGLIIVLLSFIKQK